MYDILGSFKFFKNLICITEFFPLFEYFIKPFFTELKNIHSTQLLKLLSFELTYFRIEIVGFK